MRGQPAQRENETNGPAEPHRDHHRGRPRHRCGIARLFAANGATLVLGDLDGEAALALAAIELVTRVMTAQLAAPGITFNAIAPGAVETEMAAALHDPATRRAFQDRTPQGRYGTVDEIAAAALFLASEAAAYVCGQTLNVDGGFASAGVLPARERGPSA